ncbi:hypothetical protein ACFYYY_11560 [Streptomyces sp. NPDC001834]|uniref:hypothetical protein n=1 Tax=Streptomyces sp. NPDC001834 TaxID=3364616 RepID=UPI003674A335
MRSMRGIADRMLERLVPSETAGACEWWYRCIRDQPCAGYNQYTQRVWSCDLNRREFVRCGCTS